MSMELPVYNCKIDEDINDETGIVAISFVDCPANEVDFVALREENEIHLNKNVQKQILTGVVLKPEQLIYRNSSQMGECYIKFSSHDIEKISQKMMRTGVALHNTTHQHQIPLKGNYLTELWIVENPENDKSNALGFKNLPKGTLMCSYKVEDKDYWNNEVMTGHVKGFSLEGLFAQELNFSKHNNKINNDMSKTNKKKESLIKKIGRLLLDIDAVESEDTTGSGEQALKFDLEDGNIAVVSEDGFATVNEETMSAGKHKLADGNLLVIGEGGKYLGTESPSDEANNSNEAAAAEALKKQKKEVKMEGEGEPTTSELQAKIAEMQQLIDDLQAQLDAAQGALETTKEEITELKKVTPSSNPVTQKLSKEQYESLSHSERMALALNQSMQNKKK